ncbi:MAG: type II toxin-antitoxin system VapC family toxin [Lentisphaerae bacterium]|nr:type II toxin-antitoxin system VapC family toxin [Lentisphaerota bacterium]
MIALDTNILVRFLVRDDETQAHLVYARFKRAESARETLFVPLVVLLETFWVLESAYDKTRTEILDALEDLKNMPILKFEKDQVLHRLLFEGRKNQLDVSDLLIALSAQSCGCTEGLTFDKKATSFPFFRLLTHTGT